MVRAEVRRLFNKSSRQVSAAQFKINYVSTQTYDDFDEVLSVAM